MQRSQRNYSSEDEIIHVYLSSHHRGPHVNNAVMYCPQWRSIRFPKTTWNACMHGAPQPCTISGELTCVKAKSAMYTLKRSRHLSLCPSWCFLFVFLGGHSL